MGAWAADGTTAQVAVDGTTCTLTAGDESTRGELFVVDGDRNAPLDLMAADGPVAVNLQVGAIGAWTRLDV